MPEHRFDFFREREEQQRRQQLATEVSERRSFFEERARLGNEAIKPGSLGVRTAFQTGLSSSPELDLQIIAQRAFPDLPDEERMQRVSFVNGRPVILTDDGLQFVDSGFAAGAANFLGEAGPAVLGGLVGSFVGTPLLGGGLGAGAGEGLRRIGTGAATGEPEPTEDFLRAVGFEVGADLAFGKLFQFAGAKFAGARAPGAKLDDLDPKALANAQEEIFKKTGIRVDLAQLSERASLSNLRDWAARFPGESADILRALNNLQSEQSQAAATRIMDAVITTGERGALGGRVRNAADLAIQVAKEQRRQITKPLYDAAFNTNQTVDVASVISRLDGLVEDSKGPIQKVLKSARELFNTTRRSVDDEGKVVVEEVLDTSLRGLHNTKRALDALIEGTGETQLSSEMRFLLRQVRGDLVQTLTDSSKLYRHATQRYAEETAKRVTPLTDGAIGAIARLDDPRAATAGAKLLSGRQVTPSEVRLARDAITKADPKAWNAALRLFLDDAFEKAATETQGATVRNFAGKFRQAVSGTPRQRAIMREALGADVLPLFDDTMEAFRLVSNLPIVGSNTARDQLITRANEGTIVSAVRLLRQFGTNVLDRMGERSAGRYATRVAEAMTDPAKVAQLKELRKLPKSAERALLIAGVVFGNLSVGSQGNGEGLTTPPTEDQQAGLAQ